MASDPDFGQYLSSLGLRKNIEVSLIPFTMFGIGVTSKGHYCAMSCTNKAGKNYSCTLGFDKDILDDILRLIPPTLSKMIRRFTKDNEDGPAFTEPPMPAEFGVDAKIGEEVINPNERFVPLVVTRVFGLK